MRKARWALEIAPNPSVLRLHVDSELTTRTIITCPPEEPPPRLAMLLSIDGVRSIDLHRYRVRLNLAPGAGAGITAAVEGVVGRAWGDPETLADDDGPKAFESHGRGPRVVAESPEMAEGARDPRLPALFEIDGVAEVIAGHGLVLVRLGRLFRWTDDVRAAVSEAVTKEDLI